MSETQQTVQELKPVSDRVAPHRSGTTLVEVEVDCRCDGLAINGGYVVPPGKSRLTIASADLPALLAHVEELPDEVERAVQRFERKLDQYVATHSEGMLDGKDLAERKEELRNIFPNSPEAFFFEDHGRGVRALRSARVLTDNIVVPVDEAVTAREKALGTSLGEAVRGAFDPTALAAMISAAVAAGVKEVLASQNGNQNQNRNK